ncbi:aminoglycoside phosphotransferase family protein (plasmid) [Sphingobium sp. SJ10-10]|uniref:aminoglycoside phosphotransferase family protein n=1 Tax=Sphingobium sp. SJ10-10 TaxID=3114999 RepID=UPI002E1780C8|nr:aminoglycoside phosphotransferase family protein [Sphingobium sp. SJ10-10]
MGASIEAIRTAFEAERDHDRPVTVAHEVPTSYKAITGEWLTAVLCKDVPGGTVTDFRFDERDDGSSNRRRIFLSYNDAAQAAGMPATVFCKAAETLENRIVLGVSDTAQAEADFYNLVRPRINFEAPNPRFARFDPSSYAYFIMMDDMAGKVHFPDERTTLTRQQAEGLVTTLSNLHSRFYDSPELGTETLPFKHWPRWWRDMMTGAPDFPDCCDKGFEAASSVLPDGLLRRRSEIWEATEKSVARHLELPRTLIHSDVHFKNWYITPDDRMGLADWQLTTIGHWSRDFIFSTMTALTVEQRREWLEDLLRLYLDLMAAKGVPVISFDEALRNIRQQMFTAFAFWTITMRPTEDMPAMQPEHTTFEFLRRMGAAIDDYGALDAF